MYRKYYGMSLLNVLHSECIRNSTECCYWIYCILNVQEILLNVLRNVATECTILWMYKKYFYIQYLQYYCRTCSEWATECTLEYASECTGNTTECRYWMYDILNSQNILLNVLHSECTGHTPECTEWATECTLEYFCLRGLLFFLKQGKMVCVVVCYSVL